MYTHEKKFFPPSTRKAVPTAHVCASYCKHNTKQTWPLKDGLGDAIQSANALNAGSLAEKPRAAGRETLLVHTRAKEVVAR